MKFADLVAETTTSTSTSVIALAGAKTDQRTFASAWPVGTTDIAVYIKSGAAYEFSLYTLTSANQLTRQGGIRSSSNGGSTVTFPSGSRDVLNDVPAEFLNSLFSSADTTDVASLPTTNTIPSGAYVLLLGSDGTLSKTLASNLGTASSGGGTTPTDTTAPTLSALSASATGATTATGTVTTNEANGTLYWLYSTSATATSAQVKGGSSKTVTATGAQTLAGTGLTAPTSYYLHALHRDAAGNDSAVLDSASFNTNAAPAAGLYQVRTTNTSGQKINGVNYFPPAGSTTTMARAANGVDYFTNNNDIFVSVLKADGATMAPSPVKFVWLKSSTQCPLTFADSALPVGINGNTEAYTDAFRTVNIIYGNTFNAGSVYARGTPGTYYLWAVTSDGFVGVYDNGTGTPIGWNLVGS